jgi:GNAT superfamily N-acetyltransferase
VQTATTPEILVLAASRTLTIPQVSSFSATAIPGLEADARAHGLTFIGPWIFVSHNLPQDATTTFSLKVCRAIEPPEHYQGNYIVEPLPPLPCAMLDYKGPLQGIFEGGYTPLLEQVLQSGIPLTGEIREVYHVWTTPESPDNHVQIQVGLTELPADGNLDTSSHVSPDASATGSDDAEGDQPAVTIASPAFTIERLAIPESPDDPVYREFAEMVEARNAIEAHAIGSWALAVTPEELLPVFQNQEYDPKHLYVARVNGRIVGRGIYTWSSEKGTTVTWVFVEILPEYRNQGIGGALWDYLESLARESGRPVVQTNAIHTTVAGGERLAPPTGFGEVPASDPGVRFLANHGYKLEQIARISFLDLPVDPDLLGRQRREAEAKAGSDYRVVTWHGRVPEHWLADVAYLKNRMSVDEPSAGLEVTEETWDEARVRKHDEAEIAGGRPMLVAAVEHIPSGKLVGINELSLANDHTRPVGQEDTLVLAEHRGHRLGMLLKVANLQELARVAPEAPLVFTFNAEENRYMLNVNEAVGFRPAGYEGVWKKDLA